MIQPEPFNRFRFRRYARELSKAVSNLAEERAMQFDTRKISKADLTKAIDRGDVEARTTAKTMKWHDQILEVNWAPSQQAETMSITGLQQGAFQSKLAEMRQKIADSQTKGLSRIDSVVTAGAASLEQAAESAAAKAQKEVDDALQEFATITNGGPA